MYCVLHSIASLANCDVYIRPLDGVEVHSKHLWDTIDLCREADCPTGLNSKLTFNRRSSGLIYLTQQVKCRIPSPFERVGDDGNLFGGPSDISRDTGSN